MKILFYSTKDFEKKYLEEFSYGNYELQFTEKTLSPETASLANGFEVISIFTGDDASAPVLEKLQGLGVRLIAIRAAGFDNVDISKASELDITVTNVPAYSPHAIAEHALALMLALNRKLVLSNNQVHNHNFCLDNLVGFDMHGKTIGIIGTGRIGSTLIGLLEGFGCKILAFDIIEDDELKMRYRTRYVSLQTLCNESDIISIHTPLAFSTKYMVNKTLIQKMKKGVMLINTSRGACVNTEDVLHYLENGHIGYYGADVYEKEKGVFFYDWSGKKLDDPMLQRLLALPNVLITPHQAFATTDALANIARTTFYNIFSWEHDKDGGNTLTSTYDIRKKKAVSPKE